MQPCGPHSCSPVGPTVAAPSAPKLPTLRTWAAISLRTPVCRPCAGQVRELSEQRAELLQLLQLPLSVLQEQVPRGPPGSSLGEMGCTHDVRALLECLHTCTHSCESVLVAARAAAGREDITQARSTLGAAYRANPAGLPLGRLVFTLNSDTTQALVGAGCEAGDGEAGRDEAREAVFAEALEAYGG